MTGAEATPRLARSLAVWGGLAVLMAGPVLALGMISAPNELVFLGGLLVIAGGLYEISTRIPPRFAYAAGAAVALVAALGVVWINGAVGIIGSEDNPHNRIFLAPIATALAGALLALLRARGLALAMAAAAAVQIGVFVYAWAAGFGFTGPISVFFSAFWLIAAGLFRRAAVGERPLRA